MITKACILIRSEVILHAYLRVVPIEKVQEQSLTGRTCDRPTLTPPISSFREGVDNGLARSARLVLLKIRTIIILVVYYRAEWGSNLVPANVIKVEPAGRIVHRIIFARHVQDHVIVTRRVKREQPVQSSQRMNSELLRSIHIQLT